MQIPLRPGQTAVVFTDPQNEMLSPGGAAWDLAQDEVLKNQVVPNLVRLRNSAAAAGIPVFYAPHIYSDEESQAWEHLNPAEQLMFERRMYRQGTWGADWPPDLVPDENTCVLSPHKVFSSFWSGDLGIQLRQRNIDTLILAGMAANLCVESHLRDAVEQGFKVIVVQDATAGLGAAATAAARTNYELIAHEVTTTQEITAAMMPALPNPWSIQAPPRYPGTRWP